VERSEYEIMFSVEDGHWWFRCQRMMAEHFLKKHRASRTGRILDAGCGTGGMLRFLDRRREGSGAYGPMVGIDASRCAVELCRRGGSRNVLRASVTLMPFKRGSFDAVCSMDVLCVAGVDSAAALGEIRRVLGPGGLLMLNLPAHGFLRSHHDLVVDIGRRYGRVETAKMLRRAGFGILQLTHWNTFLFGLAVPGRLLDRWMLLGKRGVSDLRPLPPFLNSLFFAIARCEALMLRRLSFPFGLSIFCAAVREE